MPPKAAVDSGELPRIIDLGQASLQDLRSVIHSFPVIDNHAHNLLKHDKAYGSPDFPLEQITSEAQGDALQQSYNTALSHIRAVKQLSQFFGCEESWAAVQHARNEFIKGDYEGLITKCFKGTHSILMDDGLDAANVEPYDWHSQFISGDTLRIVRIEAVAADLMVKLVAETGWKAMPGDLRTFGKDGVATSMGEVAWLFSLFHQSFASELKTAARNRVVRGFKSVICYRTGLDVEMMSKTALSSKASLAQSDLLVGFHKYLQQIFFENSYRIAEKAFNDYLVVSLCEVLQVHVKDGKRLPVQFHTGLGDNDINLIKANPAYLQPLIAAYPSVDFVLLHSSYPYTREAGYLASAYLNAYLDIGEVFPMLSRDGEEAVLKQALELVPGSKILWSTDGHFFPETYWLANQQFRQALDKVLTTGIELGDYTVPQAVNLAVDILFWNSDQVYGLDEGSKHPHLLSACGRGHDPSKESTTVATSSKTVQIRTPTSTASSNSSILESYLAKHPDLKYIWLQWVDYTNTIRLRMTTVAEFIKLINSGSRPGITMGVMRLTQDDNIVEGGTATGVFYLQPDLTTLCRNIGIPSKSATVQNFWQELDGNPIEGCPRSTLQKYVDAAKQEFDIDFLVGFEVEIVFVRPSINDAGEKVFLPWHEVHAWSGMSNEQLDAVPMVEQIVEGLAHIGIYLPQFHAEAAPGQWEFVLPPMGPLQAVDALYKARQTIQNIAKSHGLKATVYPRPYPWTCGSASHAHFSLSPLDHESSFLAGILEHLPSILAFTLAHPASYERVVAGIWAGGVWVGWGTQNREMPLRKVEPGHYELKTIDGLANMYFAMAALIASGIWGIRSKQELTYKDCPKDASTLTDEERAEYGINKPLPHTLEQSLTALSEDKVLLDLLGHDFCDNYIALKKTETQKIAAMSPEKGRVWLMERY